MEEHPICVLHEWCQAEKYPAPVFEEEKVSLNASGIPIVTISISVNGNKYLSSASSKADARAKAAEEACNALGLHHTGAPIKTKIVPIKGVPIAKNSINILHEACRSNRWPDPILSVVKESRSFHNSEFVVCYFIGKKRFPCGAGRNKDAAKKRAAARALSKIRNIPLREIMLGPDPGKAFGIQVAEYCWEAFGILCEEFGEDVEFCQKSNLSCFLVEDTQDGSLRVVSMGTGYNVAEERYRICNGETIIDSHSVVVARRGLLVFFYEQLLRMLDQKESIFKFSNESIVLNDRYQIHLYMKDAPCGNATIGKREKMSDKVTVKNHKMHYNKELFSDEHLRMKCECGEMASCSDKILMWNVIGLQGALLGTIIPSIYINSITITNGYCPNLLVRAFCCRYGKDDINHPWIHPGNVTGYGIENSSWRIRHHSSNWSVYWTHGTMDLTEELLNLSSSGGVVDATTGAHLKGSERDGEIPIICKRNMFRLFKKVIDKADTSKFQANKTYAEQKNRSMTYKIKKNEFFKHIEMMGLGQFPIIDRKIDNFTLFSEDLTAVL